MNRTRGAKKSTATPGGFKMANAVPVTPPKDTTATTSSKTTPNDSFLAAFTALSSVVPTTLSNILPEIHINLFCLSERSGDLVLVGAKGRICHINLYASKPILRDLTPTFTDTKDVFKNATRLTFNSNGTKVLVENQSGNGLYVFNLPLDGHHRLQALPYHVKIQFQDGTSRVASVPPDATETAVQHTLNSLPISERSKVKTVYTEVYEIECRQILLLPTVTVQSTLWHPLTDSHVVVLTSTDEILVYATNDSTFSPEQSHSLNFQPTSASITTTSLCFGPATGWETFTCYLLRSNGEMYALSPLIPIECKASTSHLHFLHQKTEGLLTQSSLDMESRIQLKAQKHWLSHIWPNLPPQDEDLPSITSFITSDTASQVLPDRWPVKLQGPFKQENKWNPGKDDKALSVVCVSYPSSNNNIGQPPVLAVSWASGHVTIMILEGEVRPVWQSKNATTKAMSLFTVECLNLGTTSSNGKLQLTVNPFMPYALYCFHSTGTHLVHLNWMKTPLSPPLTSAVHRVFSISPDAPAHVIGSQIISTVERGHVLILFLSNGKWEIVNLSANTASLPSKLSKDSTTMKKDGIEPLEQLIENLKSKHVTERLHVSGHTSLCDTSIDTFKFVQDHMPHLLDQVKYIETIHLLTKNRVELHKEWNISQKNQVNEIKETIETFKEETNRLKERLRTIQLKQNQSNQRASAILQALKENQSIITKAEKKYKQELLGIQHDTRRLVPKVTQMNMEIQSFLRKGMTQSNLALLSQDKARICHDVLTAESQLIADTTKLVHQLMENMKQLRF